MFPAVFRQASAPPRLITLYLLAAMAPMTLNMIVPSFANIAADLNADYAVISLALGGYLAVTALVEIVIGPLSDRVGRRPVVLAALAVFIAASTGCAMAESAEWFLAFRMLQAGMVSGFVLSMVIVRDTTDGPDVPRILGKIGMAMAIAPMLGPMVGSALDVAFGWRMVFALYAAVGVSLLLITWVDLGETLPRDPAASGQDKAGMAALLREPLFWCYAGCTTFSTGCFYIFLAGAPLIASSVFGITTAELGVYVGSITAGFMAGSFLASRLATLGTPIRLMLAGRLVACGGMLLGMAILASGIVSPLAFFGCTICIGIGNGLTMPNSNAGAMSVVPRLAGGAAGITGALTLGAGAVLSTLAGYLLAEDPDPSVLLSLLFLAAFAGLVAAAVAGVLERRRSMSDAPGRSPG
jgi:Bcr/CflA subfamily drug resistance transporter